MATAAPAMNSSRRGWAAELAEASLAVHMATMTKPTSSGAGQPRGLPRGVAEGLLRDDELLDLAGALVEAEQASVAIDALDRGST
jgi:hypothetical protein